MVELCFALLILIPLLLGTAGIGINLVNQMLTVQLARDAGYMYARQVDFSQTATQTVAVNLGAGVGLSATASQSKALLVLSAVKYVDSAVCKSDNKWNTVTDTPNGCTNYRQWVFAQRIAIGDSSLASSTVGSPASSGSSPVTIDSLGNISLDAQVTNSGDVAVSALSGGVRQFAGISPYATSGSSASGLPSGQVVYVAEAFSKGFKMLPFAGGGVMSARNLF
jgi:hypothetical protein